MTAPTLWRAAASVAALALLAALAPGLGVAEPESCAAPGALIRIEPRLDSAARKLATEHKLIIVAVGSSSTQGAGASNPALSYPSRLEAELKARFPQAEFRVVNRGRGGEDVPEEVERLASDVIVERPDLVIWQLGTNAVLRRDNLAADAELTSRLDAEKLDACFDLDHALAHVGHIVDRALEGR